MAPLPCWQRSTWDQPEPRAVVTCRPVYCGQHRPLEEAAGMGAGSPESPSSGGASTPPRGCCRHGGRQSWVSQLGWCQHRPLEDAANMGAGSPQSPSSGGANTTPYRMPQAWRPAALSLPALVVPGSCGHGRQLPLVLRLHPGFQICSRGYLGRGCSLTEGASKPTRRALSAQSLRATSSSSASGAGAFCLSPSKYFPETSASSSATARYVLGWAASSGLLTSSQKMGPAISAQGTQSTHAQRSEEAPQPRQGAPGP